MLAWLVLYLSIVVMCGEVLLGCCVYYVKSWKKPTYNKGRESIVFFYRVSAVFGPHI